MTIQDLIRKYRPGFVLESAMISDLEAFRDAEIARFMHENGLESVFKRMQAREKGAKTCDFQAG